MRVGDDVGVRAKALSVDAVRAARQARAADTDPGAAATDENDMPPPASRSTPVRCG